MKTLICFFVLAICWVIPLSAMGPGAGMGGPNGFGGPGSQGGAGKGNMEKMQKSYGMGKFSKYTIITIDATISEVGSNEMNKNNFGRGLHLYVTSNKGMYKVHVSPQFWIDKNSIEFKEGEKLKITGSTFKQKGKNNIYAVSITKADGTKYNFRDPETGDGLWKNGMKGSMKDKNRNERQKEMQEKMMKKMQAEMMESKE
jgi:hypothetical protein